MLTNIFRRVAEKAHSLKAMTVQFGRKKCGERTIDEQRRHILIDSPRIFNESSEETSGESFANPVYAQ